MISAGLLLFSSDRLHSLELLYFVHNGFYCLRVSVAVPQTETTPEPFPAYEEHTVLLQIWSTCFEQCGRFRWPAQTCRKVWKDMGKKKCSTLHLSKCRFPHGELVEEEDLRKVSLCACIRTCIHTYILMYRCRQLHISNQHWCLFVSKIWVFCRQFLFTLIVSLDEWCSEPLRIEFCRDR